jgi:hypothetical protein
MALELRSPACPPLKGGQTGVRRQVRLAMSVVVAPITPGRWAAHGSISGEASRGVRLIDTVGRLFLCARCREQVVLCRRCDRSQRYCGQACSDAVRQDCQRAAGQRYQRSDAGRAKHAERSRRWRLSQKEQQSRSEPGIHASAPVQHHGPPGPIGNASGPPAIAERCPASAAVTVPAQWHCPACARPLQPWVRLGFTRASASR